MEEAMEPIINAIFQVGVKGGLPFCLTEMEIIALCSRARDVFMSQPPFLEIGSPVKVCGDTHGQFPDLIRLLNRGGFPPDANYLFLGDYVDRGKYNLEGICLLLAFKCRYPLNFFLLRGNHECASINYIYGFFDECRRRYSVRLWKAFQDVFNVMPFVALIEGKILCMHGGISPQLKSFNQLHSIKRPVEPPPVGMPGPIGLLQDILWSDPEKFVYGWKGNSRGISYLFGADVLREFCEQMDIDLVARAHQVVQDGYEFFGNRRLVTIFSAPNYCGEFQNAAGMMNVDESLRCSFEILRSSTKSRLPSSA